MLKELGFGGGFDPDGVVIRKEVYVGGELAGYATGSLLLDNRVSLDSVHVLCMFRKRGIGSEAVRGFLEKAKKMGGITLEGELKPELSTIDYASVKRFYERIGFEVTDMGKDAGTITFDLTGEIL